MLLRAEDDEAVLGHLALQWWRAAAGVSLAAPLCGLCSRPFLPAGCWLLGGRVQFIRFPTLRLYSSSQHCLA